MPKEPHFVNRLQLEQHGQQLADDASTKTTLVNAINVTLKEIRNALSLRGRAISSSGSVYIGCAGLAYMYWHLASHVKRGLVLDRAVLSTPEPAVVSPSLVSAGRGCEEPPVRGPAGDALRRAAEDESVTAEILYDEALAMCYAAEEPLRAHAMRRVTFLEGYSGVLALRCALHAELGQQRELQQCLGELVSFAARATQALPQGECEVLYGRAGLLHSLLFVDRTCPGVALPSDIIQALVTGCVQEGKRCVALAAQNVDSELATAGLLYEWHGKAYLGAAHGVLGIVHELTEANKFVKGMEGCSGIEFVTKRAVLALAGHLAFPSGNVPSSLGSDNDRLVQWCHGAPGLLMALSTMHAHFGSTHSFDFQSYMRRAEQPIWQRGLLRKGLGLCHGVAGNGYAFLSAYRATGKAHYLEKAIAFGLFACEVREELLHVPDHPFSLYEGVAGAVCFWADLLFPSQSHFPGFELPPRTAAQE